MGGSPESFRRGEEYYRGSAISNTFIQGMLVSDECAGTYATYYRAQVELDQAGIADASCTCIYEYGGHCKHWHVDGLANQLREVEESAMKFLDAGDAESAFEILLVLLEECSWGIENIDDSNGELGGFVGDLGTPLAEAILSMGFSQVERDRLARRLENLIDCSR